MSKLSLVVEASAMIGRGASLLARKRAEIALAYAGMGEMKAAEEMLMKARAAEGPCV